MMLSDPQLLRYGRQVIVPDIGVDGQLKILNSKVLIVGLGGLGCPVATYLAGSGIGTLYLSEHDTVSCSNLHRQTLYARHDVNDKKVSVAIRQLRAMNNQLDYIAQPQLTDQLAANLVPKVDLVIDCTDNMEARQTINAACVKYKKPFVSAGVVGWGGYTFTYEPDGFCPCYHCIFDALSTTQNCETFGIVGAIAGMVGSMQAIQAIRILLDLPRDKGVLKSFNANTMSWQNIFIVKQPSCEVCK